MQFRESFINYSFFFLNKNSNCSTLHSDSEKTNEYFKKEKQRTRYKRLNYSFKNKAPSCNYVQRPRTK